MQKNIIKKEVPEKIDRAEVYRLIKDTEVICVDNMKLRIQDEDGTWPVVQILPERYAYSEISGTSILI